MMDLSEFVTKVLVDVNEGIKNAGEATGKKYHVSGNTDPHVFFDVAVKAKSSIKSRAGGKVKAGGLIQVVGGEVEGRLNSEDENSNVSRIKFTVYVPVSGG